jgi:catechol 2,3-dioxygenase-like lactoylglutathione lyase family enzyme
MDITGLNAAVLGVEDVDASKRYCADFGLATVERGTGGLIAEALDGTHLVVRAAGDTSLPASIAPPPNLRETVWGVGDKTVIDAIGGELSKDRQVKLGGDGVLRSYDDSGYPIAFQLSCRRAYEAKPILINVPGFPPQRAPNQVACDPNAPVKPRTFSHIVYFVPDLEKAERFYVERLGFIVTDRFTGCGSFLRSAGTSEHHNLFLMKVPHATVGLNHIAFHVGSGHEVMVAGSQFERKGWKPFWGPGRHIFGSNYFWYFNSPFGGAMEFDADMDVHDDSWTPREAVMGPPTSAIWQFGTPLMAPR